ncbi:MAG TPA: hypothetical protein VFB22_05775 [Candidatus Baltobacteraceae bacterium]|nr:hypothetical protein [Candidatus Baltobacteraceae bacterium]
MRFIVLVKPGPEAESGRLPDPAMFEAMGKFNDEMVSAGVMLAAEGLHPTCKGARIAEVPALRAYHWLPSVICSRRGLAAHRLFRQCPDRPADCRLTADGVLRMARSRELAKSFVRTESSQPPPAIVGYLRGAETHGGESTKLTLRAKC